MDEHTMKILEALVNENEQAKPYKVFWDEEKILYRAYRLSGKHHLLWESRRDIRHGGYNRVDIIRFLAQADGVNDAILMWEMVMNNLKRGEIQRLGFGWMARMCHRCSLSHKAITKRVSQLMDGITDDVGLLYIEEMVKLCKAIGYSLTRNQYENIRDFRGRTLYHRKNIELLLLFAEHDEVLASMMVDDYVPMKDSQDHLSIWWYMSHMKVGIGPMWLPALADDIEYLGTVIDHVVITEAAATCLGRIKGITIPLDNALRSYFDNKPLSVYSRGRDKMIAEMGKVAGCNHLMEWLGTQFNDMDQRTRTAYLDGLSEMTSREIELNQDVIRRISDKVSKLTRQLYDKQPKNNTELIQGS